MHLTGSSVISLTPAVSFHLQSKYIGQHLCKILTGKIGVLLTFLRGH